MSEADLTAERLALTTQRYGRSLELKAHTRSTNDDARAAALAGAADGHTVVADSQASGRGSRGRSWVSPPGLDLYVSIVARVPVSLAELPPLTLAVGLAVAETVDAFLPGGPTAQVKWPNDVWVARQKCAGVLVESVSLGDAAPVLVIGIGLNVNRTGFPADLDTTATSLALAGGAALERAHVLGRLLERTERWVDTFVRDGVAAVVQALAPRLALRGEQARCDDAVGIVEGVSPRGALQLRCEGGLRELVAGTLRPIQ